MNDRFRALIAHQTHEVEGTHEANATPRIPKIKIAHSKDKNDPIDYTHLRCGGYTLMITTWRESGKQSLSWVDGHMKTIRDIDIQIALLQEARRVMQGDEKGEA